MYVSQSPTVPGLLRPLYAALFLTCAVLPQTGRAQSTSDRPEEIIVTSSMIPQPRRQIATAVSSIDFDEIELRGYNSLADVLRTQTGIGVSNSGGPGKATSVRIRGEESYRTVLIIDGVRALDPSAPQVAPDFGSLLTTNDLQRVEILRGPQGFMYGADAGGVVNVMTKRGADELGGQIGIEGGEFATRKIDGALSGGSDKGDYYFSVTDLQTDGFNARVADSVLQDDDGADNTTLHAKLGWNVSDNVRLQLVARDVDAEAQYDGCFSSVTFTTVHDCVGTTEQSIYKLSAEQSSGNFTNTFGYSGIDTVRDDYAEGLPAFGTEGEINRFEYTGSYKQSDAFGIVYGLDFHEEELVDDDGPHSRDQKGYYLEYQGAYNDAFFMTLGARYDDSDDFGAHTSSRLSLAYVQDLGSNRSIKYRGSAGTGFRAPSLYEIAYNAGPFAFPPAAGLTLKEEASEGYDVGIEYDSDRLHFEVTYFDQKIDDEVYFDLVNFSGYLQSEGVSTSEGFEIGATVPFGERWELIANWLNNETDSATADLGLRVRRPENLGNFGVLYRADKLSFIANYRLARDAYDIDPNQFGSYIPADDYDVLDLSVSFRASDLFEVYGRLENATDETYQEVAGYYGAPRALYAGVRLRF